MQIEVRPRIEAERDVTRARPRRRVPWRVIEFVLFYIAAFARFLYYGFAYYPQLDDYIQFDKYARFAPLGEMIERLGLLASRPLAGIADIALWSKFWGDGMIVAVALIAALWVGSAMLFRRVFDRLFGCGALFSVLYLLLPLNFEGTYWLSAANRIVVGMFFCALALWCYLRVLESGRWYGVGLVLAQALSFCFYEQTLALCGGAVLGLGLIALTRRRWRLRALWGGATLVNLAAYFAFTGANATGTLAERMQLVLPWHEGYFTYFLPQLTEQLRSAFFGGGFYTLTRGTARGLALIADGGWWYLALFLVIAVGVGAFAALPAGENSRATRRIGPIWLGLAYAALLVVASISPFFVVGNPWFSLRGTVPALAGLALLADLTVRACFGRHARLAGRTAAALAAVLTLVCGIAAVSELHDYRETYRNDQIALEAIAETLDGAEGKIGILNLNPSALPEQNCFYHEHIHGVTESAWAMQGALWAMTETVPDVYPLATDAYPFYVGWNRDLKRIGAFDALYWWDDGALIPLTATGSDESGWIITDESGQIRARVWEHEGFGYLE